MVVQLKLMTVEEFWEQYAGKPYDLIDGEVIEIMPTGVEHGMMEHRLSRRLGNWADDSHMGRVLVGEVGVQLGPHTVRGVDIAFLSNASLAKIKHPHKYLPFGPDLAVEIVSPGNTANEIASKVDLYLRAGTRLVWIVYPELQRIDIYEAGGRFKSVKVGDMLDGGDVLPGLQIPVSDLFPPAPEQP